MPYCKTGFPPLSCRSRRRPRRCFSRRTPPHAASCPGIPCKRPSRRIPRIPPCANPVRPARRVPQKAGAAHKTASTSTAGSMDSSRILFSYCSSSCVLPQALRSDTRTQAGKTKSPVRIERTGQPDAASAGRCVWIAPTNFCDSPQDILPRPRIRRPGRRLLLRRFPLSPKRLPGHCSGYA